MKDTTYKKLLKDLQKLQKKLVTAYATDVRASGSLTAQVTERWHAAEVGGRVDAFIDVVARRSAVQFLLRIVYVRVLEDLGALSPARIRGQWGFAAFKEMAPALGIRGYLGWVFRDLAKDFPALFTPGPDELPLPSEDLVREVWELWHREDGKGGLLYDWQATDGEPADFDSRFLGDLYQDLDREVRKRYALLQTPVFVEEYILDHTLTPALLEFDPAELQERGETFRIIDPTCGSGHFLIGAFHRLADWWEVEHGLGKWEAAERSLQSVWGADLNPHAVDIARIRLLLEVRKRTGVSDLERLSGLALNLAVMDTLIPWERLEQAPELFPEHGRLAKYGTVEEREANAAFLARDFHVVVGNPPYITPKDDGKKDDYRIFWPQSCHRAFAMSAPFLERLITLSVNEGFSGQITANSFMKREFGKPLVTKVIPQFDLSRVVDTSGAYIPGHGTPTVLIFARNRRPQADSAVDVVLGVRGEPTRPDVAAEGLVWMAIRSPEEKSSRQFVTATRWDRAVLGRHPWSLQGGAAPMVTEAVTGAGQYSLESVLPKVSANRILGPGRTVHTGEDDVFTGPTAWMRRAGLPVARLYRGQAVRDYATDEHEVIVFPYEQETLKASSLARQPHFWRFRAVLKARRDFGRTVEERGLTWTEWSMFFPYRFTAQGVGFPFVSTHNHFAIHRKAAAFNRTAPVIKLPATATEDDHLDLLGLLNSSTLGFWMKQVFFNKGDSTDAQGARTTGEAAFDTYEYDATKLKKAPLTERDRPRRVALARALDATAQQRATCLPSAVLGNDWTAADLPTQLDQARARYQDLTHHMVALQEELDWLTYQSYGLLGTVDVVAPDQIEPLSPGHRPFEILAARADAQAAPEEKSAWWTRHGHPKVTDIPANYSDAHRQRLQARMDLIASDDKLALLETFPFKRRWQLPDLDKETPKAAESWLLDRLEDLFAEGGALSEPRPYRREEIVTAWTRDPRVVAAASVYVGSSDLDLFQVAEDLLSAESMPDNPRRVYTTSGHRKLDAWKEVWALQDREDAGEDIGTISKPPEFKRPDFLKPAYFSIRGKLNVPRERFIAFEDLTPIRYGWNGWRDLERGLAQVEAYTEAESDPHNPLPAPTHEDPRRCGVTLGLWESLDDVRRWSGADPHSELSALAQESCRQQSCPCDLVKRWQSWVNGEFEVTHDQPETPVEVTVEDRAAMARVLKQGRADWLSLRDISRAAAWSAEHAKLVLDDLVASGDAATKGRGARTMYGLPESARTQLKLL